MDEIDRVIIGTLAMEGRIPTKELAAKVGLGASATGERLRRLEADGVIAGYTVVLNNQAVGANIDALIDLQLEPDNVLGALDDSLREIPEIVDAMHLTGRYDYQLRVQCGEVQDLERVLISLKDMGARTTETRIILRQVEGMPRIALTVT